MFWGILKHNKLIKQVLFQECDLSAYLFLCLKVFPHPMEWVTVIS